MLFSTKTGDQADMKYGLMITASATLLLMGTISKAGICQSYEAAYNVDVYIGEGMDLQSAIRAVVEDEYSDGSEQCWKSIKKEIRRMPEIFPEAYKAIYKKMPR
ncbi:hypothetical protein [Synechococcus sp. CC9616]|uniref:hypothetical protein n=1 Tax=Synechococcus sp. CC9616 TaxID=110663 RepID=UPI00048DA7F7|nr:hypothetical protein [Synechococcus sp. CC9616]